MLTRKDAALMQRLGINMVRVYNVNPDLDHDLCMSIFDAIGVYVAVDVSKPVFFLGRCILIITRLTLHYLGNPLIGTIPKNPTTNNTSSEYSK